MAVLKILPRQARSVLEIGIDGPGQMATYASLVRPDVVVITSIGSEHHRALGDLERTLREKLALAEGLPPEGTLIINGDDPYLANVNRFPCRSVLRYGFTARNDVRVVSSRLDWPRGTVLTVDVAGETTTFRTRLIGRASSYSLLAALSVGWVEGLPLNTLLRAIEGVTPCSGRMQLIRLANDAWLIRDDYKSPMETIDAALDLLDEIPSRKIVVLGDISEPTGPQGPLYRHLGERLAATVSRIVVVGNGLQPIAAGATRAGMPRSSILDAKRSVHLAVELVSRELLPGDVVLVKGRGSQRLDRVSLGIQGARLTCQLVECQMRSPRCDACPLL